MKTIIATVILTGIMITALVYGLNKTIDNRCDYYRTLNMTPAMQELCK